MAIGQTGSASVAGEETRTTATELLASGEQTMMSDSTHNFAETYTYAYLSPGSTWELMSLAGTNISAWDPTSRGYGCTRSSQTGIATFVLTGLSNNGGDESGFYRSASGSGVDKYWISNMLSDGSGLRFFHIGSDPCPSGGVTWTYNTFTTATDGSVDYPHAQYNDRTDAAYVTWRQKESSGFQAMHIGQIPTSAGTMTYYHSTCSHILSKNVNGINFAFDSANNIHLVYANQTDLTIEHEVFNPSTNKFACENEVIASYTLPSNTCSSCTGVATYNGLQTNCMRAGATPSIAIERLSTGDNLVVTFSTPGGGGCSVDSETRFYKSTNLGKNWTYEEVTGCQNSLQPRVAFAHTNGYSTDVAGRFHVMSMYVPSGDNRLAQVDWKSTNSGTSFSGTYMTAVRDTLAPVNTSNCFAGDFNGVAADNANAHFFFNWGELKSGASLWTTEGISNAN